MSQPPPSFPSSSDVPPYFDPPPLYDELHLYLFSSISSMHHEHLDFSRVTLMLDPPNPPNSIFQPPQSLLNPSFFETYSYPHFHFPHNADPFHHTQFTNNSTFLSANPSSHFPSPDHSFYPFEEQVPHHHHHHHHQFLPSNNHIIPISQQMSYHSSMLLWHQNIEPLPTLPEEPPEWESLVTQVNMIESGHECAVCLEYLNIGEQAIQLPCNHFYHRDCIAPWMERNGNCPYCRQQVVIVQSTNEEEEEDGYSSDSTFVTESDWEFDEELLDELIEVWEDADMHLDYDDF